MKVLEVGAQQAIQNSSDAQGKRADGAQDEFTRLLDDEMNTAESIPVETAGSAGIDPLSLIQAPALPSGDAQVQSPEALKSIEAGLNSLEMIGRSLQDSNVTPKSVDAMISGLAGQVDGLQKSIADLPSEHPLKQIGNELSIMSYVESVKWRRGEYL